MEHQDIVNALTQIRPNSIYHLKDNELTWLDDKQSEPTKKELEEGLALYKVKKEEEILEVQAKREALLDRLGITADEARLLLG
jgi:hypothetical protein